MTHSLFIIQKEMNKILLIETATDICSAAVADGKEILSAKCITEPRKQASGLAPLIQEVMEEAGVRISGLSAVAVSAGPGSYTGLRVGVSTAKGICFGSGLPLIGIDTLTVIAYGAMKHTEVKDDALVIPMIDARRMEVYTAVFDSNGRMISAPKAVILEPDTFSAEFEGHSKLIFTGDGAEKYKSLLKDEYAEKSVFLPSGPDAADMAVPAMNAYNEKRFEDTAYFEPFYLKEFSAAVSTRKIEAVLHPEKSQKA